MHLVKPTGHKLKWDIRLRNHDGRTVKISGDANRDAAVRLGLKVEALVKARQNGDPPPRELGAWIDNMPNRLAERLVELGLLERRRIEQGKSLDEHIDRFEDVVASRRSNTALHAHQQAERVRRIAHALHAKSLSDLVEEDILHELRERGWS